VYELREAFEAIRDFMEMGGPVLTAIAWLLFVMWIMIVERWAFFRTGLKSQINNVVETWEARPERKSWQAHQIRQAMVSRVTISAQEGLSIIKTLVALCPLMGLMGTVTGMIEVFDVMAVSGSGNARSMAGGVSKATIPTMAGMVAALAGVFATTYLTRAATHQTQLLEDHLTMDH
jgi:biopolymer transport protein ExbB